MPNGPCGAGKNQAGMRRHTGDRRREGAEARNQRAAQVGLTGRAEVEEAPGAGSNRPSWLEFISTQ